MRTPWKFYILTHRRISGSPSFNIATGALTETKANDTVMGYIVPISPENIAAGFQVGSFTAYVLGITSAPIVATDEIVYDGVTYKVKTVQNWVGAGLYVLELIR